MGGCIWVRIATLAFRRAREVDLSVCFIGFALSSFFRFFNRLVLSTNRLSSTPACSSPLFSVLCTRCGHVGMPKHSLLAYCSTGSSTLTGTLACPLHTHFFNGFFHAPFSGSLQLGGRFGTLAFHPFGLLYPAGPFILPGASWHAPVLTPSATLFVFSIRAICLDTDLARWHAYNHSFERFALFTLDLLGFALYCSLHFSAARYGLGLVGKPAVLFCCFACVGTGLILLVHSRNGVLELSF